MQYVNLGRSGLMVSRLCLGCMSFGEPGRGRHEWTVAFLTSDQASTEITAKNCGAASVNPSSG
jgi:aryl-alcohol dehydrogenase-like predicted oxidoreductase